ncbi:hypothetical protein SLEP1_g5911 [Rubroshorea leprosula]|uniref:Uncharacterized protein n=1 Tax=Rubroshorea leprosula TaxID=152421 RepID=A0AAV5I341_9ROSI|nr:hypothetical protein SLEP1_g5911 [Rubroshorea leprosula]
MIRFFRTDSITSVGKRIFVFGCLFNQVEEKGKKQFVVTVDQTRDLQIFSLTLSQLSYPRLCAVSIYKFVFKLKLVFFIF